jgi:hypothetical protein
MSGCGRVEWKARSCVVTTSNTKVAFFEQFPIESSMQETGRHETRSSADHRDVAMTRGFQIRNVLFVRSDMST